MVLCFTAPSHITTSQYNGLSAALLPKYSDRIAQDSHLIPSSPVFSNTDALNRLMELYK